MALSGLEALDGLWINDQELQGAGHNIYRYNIVSGARLEILEKNPNSRGNLSDYDFIDSTYVIPSFIIGSSRLDIELRSSFSMGKGNKIIKLLQARGWLLYDNGTDEKEFVSLLLGFLVYSFDRIPFTYPWFHLLFWTGGIALCVVLAVVVIVRDRTKIV